MPNFFNADVAALARPSYSPAELDVLLNTLQSRGTFEFPRLETGLFPAAAVNQGTSYTKYDSVWVRDNVHIAHAHYVTGRIELAVNAAESLLQHFANQRPRFERIVDDPTAAADASNRPHVRFDGRTLGELPERWAHAQNDALGYFLWLYCKLAGEDAFPLTADAQATLALFPSYLSAISYWEDEDSGHWEEERKVSASSIGAVAGGLRALQKLSQSRSPAERRALTGDGLLEELIGRGQQALDSILPAESVAPEAHAREFDAALLFLIYPLEVVTGDMADAVIQRTVEHLQGEVGICRYRGDSFWSPNYRKKLRPDKRTADWSEDVATRNALAETEREAQWCIFDPTLSTIYGQRYQQTRESETLRLQTEYLNRSLAQITKGDDRFSAWRCPELYHLEGDAWQPSDATPLLWTQANLLVAITSMAKSLATSPAAGAGR